MLIWTVILLLMLPPGAWPGRAPAAPAPHRGLDAGFFQFVVPLRWSGGDWVPAPASAYPLRAAGQPRTFAPLTLALYPRHDHSLPAHRLELAAGAGVEALAAWAPLPLLPGRGSRVSTAELWLEIRAGKWTGWVHGADAFRNLGLPATGPPPTAAAGAPAPAACYTMAAAQRLWLACGPGLQPVSLGPVGAYTIAPDGTAIALPEGSGVVVVALTALPHVIWRGGARAVAATCGTLVWEPHNRLAPDAYDLLGRKAMKVDGGDRAAVYCDRSRHLVVGLQQGTITAWRHGVAQVLSRNAAAAPVVSGNGKFVAFAEPRQLCVWKVGHGFGCLPLAAPLRPHSIDSRGAVLWDGAAGVYFWRPGMAAPLLLRRGASNPQWVDPATASRLQLWFQVQAPQWPYLLRSF